MDALNRFDAALRAMKQAAVDLRSERACLAEDENSAIAALGMLEMMARRVRCRATRGPVVAPSAQDWRERQLPAGDR